MTISDLPHHRPRGEPVSFRHADAAHRRRWSIIYPEPRVEIHPRLAEQHGSWTDDWVTVTTRRSEITLQAMVVRTIRPDTVFIPYHWADEQSANLLTHRTLDPRSKIPEFKVSACRIRKADGPPSWATAEHS